MGQDAASIPMMMRAATVAGIAVGVPLALGWATVTVIQEGWLTEGLGHLAARAYADALLSVPWRVVLGAGAVLLLARIAAGIDRLLHVNWMLVLAGVLAAPGATALVDEVQPHIRALVFHHVKGENTTIDGPFAELFGTAMVSLWGLADVGVVLLGVLALAVLGLATWRGWVTPERFEASIRRLDRPRGAAAVAVPALLAVLAVRLEIGRPIPAGPDVVLIAIDTLRADRLGLYGHTRATDPSLAAFARDAVWYRRAIAPAPWTTPSIASVLTGRHGSRFGYVDRPVALPLHVVTLAERFAQAGYNPVAVVANLYASRLAGFDQGFASWDEDEAKGANNISSASITDKALALARPAPGARPLLMWLHYYDPHCGYADHEAIDYADADYEGPIASLMPCNLLQDIVPDMNRADLDQVLALYDEEIRYTDEHIGRLFEGLRHAGRYDDALIVVFADHGEAFDDRDDRRIGHSATLHEELIHVPLLVKWPGNAHAGAVVDTPVGLTDIATTAAAVAGVGWSGPTDGIVLAATGNPDRPQLSETRYGPWFRSVVDGPLKLVRRVDDGVVWLYDVDADPAEHTDLAAERPSDVARLSGVLDAWGRGLDADHVATQDAVLSAEETKMLEELGYLEGP